MLRFSKLYILLLMMCAGSAVAAAQTAASDTIYDPEIIYSPIPRQYTIEGIEVTGVPKSDDYLVVEFSGLAVGDRIEIPGDAITTATKRFWNQNLYSNVQISVTKTIGDKAWLRIALRQQPRMSELHFSGAKKSEEKDIRERLQMVAGQQITPNILARVKQIIEKYYASKGFKNAKINIRQQPDLSKENQVILTAEVDRHNKVKVHKIYIEGNEVLSDKKIKRVMKKTNEKGDLLKIFSQKKFVDQDFEDDKVRIIKKYNELGYRDARIVADTVSTFDDQTVDVRLKVDEGKKYYISDITWVGNTVYPTETLANVLGIFPGDVYNQKRLDKRTHEDEDAVANLYLDNGYLFFNLVPIEENVKGDSVSLQMRIMEGPQARINKVVINGNDQLYEKVVRRNLRVRPGELFSKADLMRSYREIAATEQFNPENIGINPQPNQEDGTVDIVFDLESKSNDKVQASFGWGQQGATGQLQLQFGNFSMKNLFSPKSYRGIIPRGDGQTLSISAQTNAKYYMSYGINFFDPWVGGSRPNSLSFNANYSRMTGINQAFYSQNWSTAYMNSLYYQGSYGTNNATYAYQNAFDPNKLIQMAGVQLGYGTRLTWPDDYFTLQGTLGYQWYNLQNWQYIYWMQNGTANALTLGLNLSRTSMDQPIYPRRGSSFSLEGTLTPPYTSFIHKDWKTLDYKATTLNDAAAKQDLYRWIEYWKLRFKSKTFTPLTDPEGKWTLVLATRADFALLGSYNKYVRTPFETFYFGGDGMTGQSTYAQETVAMRGYENGQFTPWGYEGRAYGRFGMELRFPFLLQPNTTIYALTFVEAGNCWANVSDFSPFDLKRSAGVGARVYLSMLGFLGIDWGYGFDKVWGRQGGSQLHFVLGQEF